MYHGIECFADFHAHSIYSGHAMSSPSEMAEAAKKEGFTYLALTEHVYQYEIRSDIENQNTRPRLADMYLTDTDFPFYLCGGWEFNNFVDNPAIDYQGLKLLGWHSWFGPDPQKIKYDELIADYKRLAPHMDILVHPERVANQLFRITWQQVDFLEEICKIADANNCAVEFNTSSLRYTSVIDDFSDCDRLIRVLLDKLKEHPSVPITIGSDAHVASDIGLNFNLALSILEEFDLLNRVVNISESKCKDFYRKSIAKGNKL